MKDIEVLEQELLSIIEKQINPLSYNAWFKNMKIHKLNNELAIIKVHMEICKKILKEHYYSLILDTLKSITKLPIQSIDFITFDAENEMGLERFIEAHEEDYTRALKEIQNGRKLTHWMWYIFPQITGLGMSETAQYYEIKSLEEARAYMDNEILGTHLIEITNSLLELNTNNPIEIFGDIDSLKLKSSMTLFDYVSNNEVFSKVIDKYFSGLKDQATIKICKEMEELCWNH